MMRNSTQTTSPTFREQDKLHRERMPSSELLTVKDVAELLRVPVSWV